MEDVCLSVREYVCVCVCVGGGAPVVSDSYAVSDSCVVCDLWCLIAMRCLTVV